MEGQLELQVSRVTLHFTALNALSHNKKRVILTINYPVCVSVITAVAFHTLCIKKNWVMF